MNPDSASGNLTSVDESTPRSPSDLSRPSDELLLSAIVDSSDDAIVSKNLEGLVTSWNKSAERIFGYTFEEIRGCSIAILMPPGRESEEENILAKMRRGERVDHFETVRRRKDGQLIDVSVTISPIREKSGRIIGASKVARDITEIKRNDRAVLLLAAIVSSSEDAVVSKTTEGIITSWNESAERVFGYPKAEAIGKPVLMLVPDDRKDEEPKILARIRKGERVEHFETIRVRKNGEHFPVSLTISPIKSADGSIIGASKIARDITEMKRIAVEREQLLESERTARSQAEHANRMKDDFLSTVSHELRTPLNAIVGWIQVLKDAGAGGRPEDLAHGIEVIERNARVQAQLIDDLLDLGRIASGKMTIDVEYVEIGSIIQEAIASLRPAAEIKQIGIKTILNDVRGAMMGDKRRLQQVFWNLISNAVKFTQKGGKVVVSVARINSHVEISIADNGRGIAPEFMPHVFERFRQADSSTTRQIGGLGIGLALVKQLVDLHGGDVRVESKGLGLGSTFTVILPVVVAHSEQSHEKSGTPADALTVSNNKELAGIRVLAVDDDTDSLQVLTRILSSRQAEVKAVTSAEEAFNAFNGFQPDVILSDIGMPGQDGYELIRRIRQLPGGVSVPAAALTALARSEDRMRALNAGFQTHVSKPVAPIELVAVVRSLATLKRETRQSS